jgi:hypothetical protein
MTRTILYFVLPFVRASDGELLALEIEAATDVAKAKHHAFNLVDSTHGEDKIVGAIAFSQANDQSVDSVEDGLVIERFGDTPETVEGLV